MKTKLLTVAIVIAAIMVIAGVTKNAPSVASVQTVVKAAPAVPGPTQEDQLGRDSQPVDSDPSASAEEVAAEIAEGLADAVPPSPPAAPEAPPAPVVHPDCPDPMICKNEDCQRDYAIVFSGKFCGPCKRMHGFIAKLQAEGYRIYFWEVESFPAAANKFSIDLTPTTLFFNEGKVQRRLRGVIDEQPFRELLNPRPKTQPKYDFIGE